MLNLFNNLSLYDNNLLSYGLLLGSVTILGYSIYYFTGNIFKHNNDMVINSLPNQNNQDIIVQRLINNLESKSVPNLDNAIPNLDNSTLQTLNNKVDSCVQTGTGLLTRTDIDVTEVNEHGLFIPWDGNLKDAIAELVYGPESSVHSITEMTPTEFAKLVSENERYSKFVDSIKNWNENIENQSPITTTNSGLNSEINFLQRVKFELEKVNSQVNENLSQELEQSTSNTLDFNSLLYQNLSESVNSHDMLIRKLLDNDLIYTYAGIVNETHLRTTLELMNITLTD